MATDFSKILSKKADEIEKPKPLPVGTYLFAVPSVPKFVDIGKNETPAAELILRCLAPQDDVDEDELAEFGGIEKARGKEIRYLIWISEDAQYRAKTTLADAFGIDPAGKSLMEMFSELAGVQVMGKVTHRPSQDGTELFAQIDSVAAA